MNFHMKCSRLFALTAFTGVVAVEGLASAGIATAQSGFQVLHSFNGSMDGQNPDSALIQAIDGNFYGTTSSAGAFNSGTVFSMTPSGIVTVLHSFAGGPTDGANPGAALLQASDGNFYGTTSNGGAFNSGTVFKMTLAGTVTVLHSFAGGATDGANPHAALIQANDGNLYGTTYFGGASSSGTLFMMTPAGAVTILHAFAGGTTDGASPSAALLQAADGNFYGTTTLGGATFVGPPGLGTVFKMTPGGTVTVLVSLASLGGLAASSFFPSSLIEATDGNFYGTTTYGGFCGHNIGCGTVFTITPAGTLTVLHTFAGGTGGAHPSDALIQTTDGNFYGTAFDGDLYGTFGTVFMMTPTGTVTVLHAFAGGTTVGAGPKAALVQSTDGNLYGTTAEGGVSNSGTVFRLARVPHHLNTAAVRHDLDGDGKTDLAVFRPANGTWYVRDSSLGYNTATAAAFQWGLPGDVPISGDFDGDGKSELTIFRPGNGTWYIRYSSLGYSIANAGAFQWGLPGDIPLAGDFDGDGKTELTVFRPSNGTWYIRYSSLGYSIANAGAFQWGLPGDVPVTGDFDDDGITDLAVWRPSNGTWYIRYSSLGYSVFTLIFGFSYYQWGLPGDVPISADFDGDGMTDLAVFRPSTGEWFIRYSSQNYDIGSFVVYQWGLPGDALVE
jgi:uncharacterized repeat protein (TIGR03803 family)